MFGFFRQSLESKIFGIVWPLIDDFKHAVPEFCALANNPTLLEATTATANLAISAKFLAVSKYCKESHAILKRVEDLQFEKIKSCTRLFPINQILALQSEQAEWTKTTRLDPTTLSDLNSVMSLVFAERLLYYQMDFDRGLARIAANRGKVYGYGITGFIAKRWISHLSGRPILQEDNLHEPGLDEIASADMYFTEVAARLSDAI